MYKTFIGIIKILPNGQLSNNYFVETNKLANITLRICQKGRGAEANVIL